METSPAAAAEGVSISRVALRREGDVVLARQRARDIAARTGFDGQDQVRFATAVSELARNAYRYAGGGRVDFSIEPDESRSLLVARVLDAGPGIARLDDVLAGAYTSETGMGVGLTGARRLSDRFAIDSSPEGTVVAIGLFLTHHPRLTDAEARSLARAAAHPERGDEESDPERELAEAREQLRARDEEVQRLAQELEETNRGVLALYAELDDRAELMRSLSEAKSRFLSDVSHELRTPLTSIVNLARLLLSHADGPLTVEQTHQVSLIQRSAESLTEMIGELLDVAKIEAGRVELRVTEFDVRGLFGALRALLRPLATTPGVALVFEDPGEPMVLWTDEQRVSQVLRNFVSNALKFTEAGEVRVTATRDDGGLVRLSVTDTGIGIAAADQKKIFDEFAQIDGPIQRRVRGTGLGLAISRKLAALLGGTLELVSAPGAGSRFSLVIPADARGTTEATA